LKPFAFLAAESNVEFQHQCCGCQVRDVKRKEDPDAGDSELLAKVKVSKILKISVIKFKLEGRSKTQS